MLASIPASRLNQIGEGFGNHFRFNLMSSRSKGFIAASPGPTAAARGTVPCSVRHDSYRFFISSDYFERESLLYGRSSSHRLTLSFCLCLIREPSCSNDVLKNPRIYCEPVTI
jgi:hypothetical protein